ncbi:MAG TPA: DUF2254 domain-containing protein [Vicinamibacterales bacterium]|nr:DUF2254 domain-containing protein [Vicinamibacterales bacterium]
MRLPVGELWATLRATYWFIPAVLTALIVGLCGMLVYLDHVAPHRMTEVSAFFFPTSVEGGRALLSAIVSSMMTVVAVTFSVTIVALTVASQHYGPRLLNSFMRDTTVQVVLGLLIGTFAYSVLLLGSVQKGWGEPLHWATMGAMVLVGVSVAALIVFVHHVSRSLQISSLVVQIRGEFIDAVQRHYPPLAGEAAAGAPGAVSDVRADRGGYLQRVDEPSLVALAERAKTRITIVREPGKFLFPGVVLARVDPPVADADFAQAVNEACTVGPDRTTRHDVEFAIKQLVEIALRGLSPGVNEPFTAIVCIDRIGEALGLVARRNSPESEVRDAADVTRLVVPRQTFEGLLRAAFDPIRLFAGPNPAVYARLLDTAAALGDVIVREEDLQAVRHQVRLVREAAEGALSTPDDLAFVRDRAAQAVEALRQPQRA